MQVGLNQESNTPLYIQLYQALKEKIIQGDLKEDQRLPSQRQLADMNGISKNTVINAYDQLLVEGFIYAKERQGYYVADIDYQYHQRDQKPLLTVLEKVDTEEPFILDLTRSTADSSLFPFKEFSKIYKQLFLDYQNDIMQPSPAKGLQATREAIKDYLNLSRGVPCQTDQIVLGPNTQYLVQLLLTLFPRNIKLGLEDPGYRGLASFEEEGKLEVSPLSLDSEGVEMVSVQFENPDLILLTPNHQYPTGTIMPLARRQELLAWAREKQAFLIEDDYDSEFKYSGIPIPSLKALDIDERVIYLGSFSRVVSTNIRLAYMVLPKSLQAAFDQKHVSLAPAVNSFNEWSMALFMESGEFERHLNRSRRFYKRKRDLLLEAISRQDPQAQIYGEEAGLHVLVQPSIPFQAERVKGLARAEKIRLKVLADYADQPLEGSDQIIFLSFSAIKKDQIEELVTKLYQWIKESAR